VKLIVWRPFKLVFFNLFSAYNRDGEHILGGGPKLRIIFGEILLRVESQSLPAPYFALFELRPSASYKLAPWVAARLACPLDRL
jgi:hypothetical protein